MRENDSIKSLKNIEKRKNVEIHDVKSPLLLFNLGRAKYIAALRAANVLSGACLKDEDWDLFKEIAINLDSFLANYTETEYMQEVFLEVLYNSDEDFDIFMNEELLDVSDDEYEKFYEYVVSRDEIELFQNIYIDFICAAISMYKEQFLDFNITLSLSNRWISAVYKDEKTMKKRVDHFIKSFYAFWVYNGFQNVKIYAKRGYFGSTYVHFEVNEAV